MKKKVLIAIGAGMAFAGCQSPNTATIIGTAKGLADSTQVYIGSLDSSAPLDTVWVVNEKFTIEVEEFYPASPDFLILRFEGWSGAIPFFVEPGVIRVSGDFHREDFTLRGDDTKISGTESNELYWEWLFKRATWLAPLTELYQQYRITRDEHARDSLIVSMEGLEKELDRNEADFIAAHNRSIHSAYLLSQKFSHEDTPERMDSLLSLLSPEIRPNSFVDKIMERRNLLAGTAVGQPAPDFTLPRADGTPFTLSSLHGQVVLIDFWASWCGPCRAENPRVKAMYERYKDRGFTVVGVSIDEDREDWLKAVAVDALPWTQVSDHTGGGTPPVNDSYGVVAIPHTILVDRQGIIIGNKVYREELEALIVSALVE